MRGRGAVAGRRAAVEAAADPAQPVVVPLVEPGRLPDLAAAEVRAVRVGIARPPARSPAGPIPAACPRPASTGAGRSRALILISRFSGSRSALRYLAYPSSLKGTTVLMPSLPPSSWTTTRMRSSFSGPAACAVRARKPGSVGARAIRDESRRPRARKSRRVVSTVRSPPRNTSLVGDVRDVADRDPRSVHRQVPRGRHGARDPGAAAAAGAARSDLRGLQATTVFQEAPLLAGRRGDDGGRDPDPRHRPRRLSRREGPLGHLVGGPLRETQPHRAADLLGPGPADGRRCRRGHRCDGRRRDGGPAGAGGLLSRWQPPGGDRAPAGGAPRHARGRCRGNRWRCWTRSGD